ncbi:hypothetical protein CBOM_02039 [Ceraceosorus bombacis]|uniref:Stress response protein rds1p n=1 Tax=Ceraceosorus bombacis TaxID=401625 RepID=A0A0P1BDL8_9BASI|nr:hypothetical protein CBOM_02039 [Ceraceosorus bombacis]
MVASKFLAFLALAAAAVAAPASIERRAEPGQANIDDVILNYALTLEHLENAFYKELPSLQAFSAAGYDTFVHARFLQIGGHEASHVKFLSQALGDKATKACTYDFGVNGDVNKFVQTSVVLEGVGVSAYAGAAQNITSPAYLTAAATVLTTEARHSAWAQAAARKGRADGDPAGAAYDTPLTSFSQVYSLAAPFIKKCPDSNPALPVKAFPAASWSTTPTTGATVGVKGDGVKDGQSVAFITAAGTTALAKIQGGKVTVPAEVQGGRTYAVVIKADAKAVSDDNTVAILSPFDVLRTPKEAANRARAGKEN